MTKKHEWKSVSFIRHSCSLHYGRFMLSSLKEGQANILGTTIRRVLLAEIKGTRITHATFQLKEKQVVPLIRQRYTPIEIARLLDDIETILQESKELEIETARLLDNIETILQESSDC